MSAKTTRLKRPREVPLGASKEEKTPTSKAKHVQSSLVVRSPRKEEPACLNALLVVGTYHSVMAGLVLKKEKFFIKFSIKHHVGCLNAVAVSEKYIASCGADERVFLFTNKAQERVSPAVREKMRAAGEPMAIRLADLGSITPPAEVTTLGFTPNSQYLICGCGDGQLLAYRTRDWSLSFHLPVHERALVSFAIHPTSEGALAVSIGADRVVAVLDLTRGKLLTKWKYTSHTEEKEKEKEEPATAEDVNADAEEGEAAEAAKKRKAEKKVSKRSALWMPREDPLHVCFSPSGALMAVMSAYSFVVYEVSSMKAVRAFRYESPQPQDELHCFLFTNEDTLVFGNEMGTLLYCTLSGSGPLRLELVATLYPAALQEAATALLSRPVNADSESRQKNPLRHVNRVKVLNRLGGTVFSMDSTGIVVAWNEQKREVADEGAALSLQYVTSANCQGRVTSMNALAL